MAPNILAKRLRGVCQNDPAKCEGAESSVTYLQSLPFLKFSNDGMFKFPVNLLRDSQTRSSLPLFLVQKLNALKIMMVHPFGKNSKNPR